MAESLMQPPLATDTRFQRFYKLLDRQQQLDLTPVLIYLIELTEQSALNSLADQFSLIGDGWELAESDDVRRDLIKAAIELHRYKGTPWSIREVIRRFGLGEVDLIEGVGDISYNGKNTYNGNYTHGNAQDWAVYRVLLFQPVTN
ncbi:phage tail protein I, partial [Citrobacter portucalensis]|uniref:phage tail protein I n=1 Tax=Citrobacter portucalensis TaxID=1639133 RepID=UPI00226B936A